MRHKGKGKLWLRVLFWFVVVVLILVIITIGMWLLIDKVLGPWGLRYIQRS